MIESMALIALMAGPVREQPRRSLGEGGRPLPRFDMTVTGHDHSARNVRLIPWFRRWKLPKRWPALPIVAVGALLVSGFLRLPQARKLTTTADVVVVDVVALAADRTPVSGRPNRDGQQQTGAAGRRCAAVANGGKLGAGSWKLSSYALGCAFLYVSRICAVSRCV